MPGLRPLSWAEGTNPKPKFIVLSIASKSSLRLSRILESLSTRTNEKFSDACGLRLLGLRTTLEVLKQLPVILEAESVGACRVHFGRGTFEPDDRAAAVLRLEPRSGPRPLPELFELCNTRLDFSSETVAPMAELLRKELAELKN